MKLQNDKLLDLWEGLKTHFDENQAIIELYTILLNDVTQMVDNNNDVIMKTAFRVQSSKLDQLIGLIKNKNILSDRELIPYTAYLTEDYVNSIYNRKK